MNFLIIINLIPTCFKVFYTFILECLYSLPTCFKVFYPFVLECLYYFGLVRNIFTWEYSKLCLNNWNALSLQLLYMYRCGSFGYYRDGPLLVDGWNCLCYFYYLINLSSQLLYGFDSISTLWMVNEYALDGEINYGLLNS